MARSWLLIALLAACRLHFDDRPELADGGLDAAPSLRIRVTGWGAVTGPGGIACLDDCAYAITGPITLTAIAGEAQNLTQFCGTDATCDVQPGADVTATFAPRAIQANRVFVSAATGTLGAMGRAGLDNQCATEAAGAGLGGTWIALVSTTAEDAATRLAGSRGWVRMDGLPLLDTMLDLGNTTLPRGVALGATATPHVPGFVLTGSDERGLRSSANTCGDWTGGTQALGAYMDGAINYLVSGTTSGCTGFVYCFEVGKNVPVPTPPPAFPVGRYVFVSSGFDGTTGVAGADAACQADATAAALPGSYKAVIATTTQSALEHTGSLDGAWRRPDGASVTRTGLGGGNYSTTLAQTAARGPVLTQNFASFGASSLSARATATSSCADWSPSGAGMMQATVSTFRMSPFDNPASTSCIPIAVICVQTQ